MLWHMTHSFPDGYVLFTKVGCEHWKPFLKSYVGEKSDVGVNHSTQFAKYFMSIILINIFFALNNKIYLKTMCINSFNKWDKCTKYNCYSTVVGIQWGIQCSYHIQSAHKIRMSFTMEGKKDKEQEKDTWYIRRQTTFTLKGWWNFSK